MSAERISALLIEYEDRLSREHLAAVRDISDEAVILRIEEALQRGDVHAATELIIRRTDGSRFAQMSYSTEDGYRQVGNEAVGEIPRTRMPDGSVRTLRFDARTWRAQRWIESNAEYLTNGLASETARAVLEAASRGLASERRARLVALDLVGRVSRTSGRREGGLVGLTPQLSFFAQRARTELETKPAAFLRRKLRDERFDPLVARAAAGGGLTREQIDVIAGRYADSLLRLRGALLARGLMAGASQAAQLEAMTQAEEQGLVAPGQIEKIWHTRRDTHVRDSHALMDGQRRSLTEPFTTPRGWRMNHPHDPTLGAPAEERAGCRCYSTYRVRRAVGVTAGRASVVGS